MSQSTTNIKQLGAFLPLRRPLIRFWTRLELPWQITPNRISQPETKVRAWGQSLHNKIKVALQSDSLGDTSPRS